MDSPTTNQARYTKLTLKEIHQSHLKPKPIKHYTERITTRSKATYFFTTKKDYSFINTLSNPIPNDEISISYCQTESSKEPIKLPLIPRNHQSSQIVSTPYNLKLKTIRKMQLMVDTFTSNSLPPHNAKTSIKPIPKNTMIHSKYRCSARSQAGQRNGIKKINQDSFLLMCNVFKSSFNFVIGILDGHGVNGHLVSQFIKKYFNQYFLSAECHFIFKKYIAYLTNNKSNFNTNMKSLFASAEDALLKEDFDSSQSGTTAVIVASYGNRVICLNTGDSRAIYINDKGEVHQISQDHKPNDPAEKSRINASGGIVVGEYGNDIYRVYMSNTYEPGLALSRSIGDFNSKQVGIISEPEIVDLSIRENGIKVIIVGSDGLWDCFSNEEVKDIVQPFIKERNSTEASKELVDKAKEVWIENGKNYIDDITVVVLFM